MSGSVPGVPLIVLRGPASVLRRDGVVAGVAECGKRVVHVELGGQCSQEYAMVMTAHAEADTVRKNDVVALAEDVFSGWVGWDGDDVVAALVDREGRDLGDEVPGETLASVRALCEQVMHDYHLGEEPLVGVVVSGMQFEKLLGLACGWGDEDSSHYLLAVPIADEPSMGGVGVPEVGHDGQVPVLVHFFGEQAPERFVLLGIRWLADPDRASAGGGVS